jgi:superfamily I DNA/RNA helicase
VPSTSTIHSAKGYDAPIVFIMNAQGFGQDPKSRARFYVGATRAQLLLYITGHGEEDEGLLSEMEEVQRRLPKIGG